MRTLQIDAHTQRGARHHRQVAWSRSIPAGDGSDPDSHPDSHSMWLINVLTDCRHSSQGDAHMQVHTHATWHPHIQHDMHRHPCTIAADFITDSLRVGCISFTPSAAAFSFYSKKELQFNRSVNWSQAEKVQRLQLQKSHHSACSPR